MNSPDMQLRSRGALALRAVSFLLMISQCLAGPLRVRTGPANQGLLSVKGQPLFEWMPLEGLESCTTSNEKCSSVIRDKVVENIPNTNGSRPLGFRSIESLTFKALRIRHSLPPIPIARATLMAFYDGAIALIANDDWRPAPNSQLFTIAYGAFRLTVSSLGLPVQRDALHSWCALMKEWASRGWTQLYDVYFMDEATGITMAVSLTLVLEGQAPNQLPTKRSPPSTFPHHQKRSNPNALIIRSFQHLTYYAPAQIAASIFKDFYSLIALKIEIGDFTAQAPLHSVSFTHWGLRLSFFCYAEPVPLEFVQDFAISMIETVERGLTTSFVATYQKVTGAAFITISMELLGG